MDWSVGVDVAVLVLVLAVVVVAVAVAASWRRDLAWAELRVRDSGGEHGSGVEKGSVESDLHREEGIALPTDSET